LDVTDRIIAIGDTHGCSAALSVLVRAIDPSVLDALVLLGDYIDRGPDSWGVLEQVIALAERCTVVPLMGNHGNLAGEMCREPVPHSH
jgi:serine/threonine protein phosphatase 1